MSLIQSMTGFSSSEYLGEDFHLSIEIKSVNHRFKEYRFRMPSLFNSFEVEMRKAIAEVFKRGSFEIHVNYKKQGASLLLDQLDKEKISAYLKFIESIGKESNLDVKISPADFLRSEFHLDQKMSEEDEEKLKSIVFDTLNSALERLKTARSEEGVKMTNVLKSHRETFEEHFQKITEKSKDIETALKEKLLKKVNEFSQDIKVDENRFMQEIVFYLEKLDINEELDRIKSHLNKFDSLLEGGGEIGRKIDFFVQELNRETNTIGSKSSHKEVLDSVIQMKSQLEKVREQALNLE